MSSLEMEDSAGERKLETTAFLFAVTAPNYGPVGGRRHSENAELSRRESQTERGHILHLLSDAFDDTEVLLDVWTPYEIPRAIFARQA